MRLAGLGFPLSVLCFDSLLWYMGSLVLIFSLRLPGSRSLLLLLLFSAPARLSACPFFFFGGRDKM